MEIFVEEKLNDELKRQGIDGSISLYSLYDELSLFYEKNGSRYFFFFKWQIDTNYKTYKGMLPCVFDSLSIVKQIQEKFSKIDTSYIV